MQELNPKGVHVQASSGELTEALVAEHDAVIFTRGTKPELLRWNAFCRSRTKADGRPSPISFMYCLTAGTAVSTVELASGAHVRLDALRVGERIRTPAGFEPVVGFLHADAAAPTAYRVFKTDTATMAISDKHWLFVDGVEADPATVTVGQTVETPHGPQAIRSITTETIAGAYHLIVPSGAYYVDGVLASTYIAHVPHGVWRIFADGYASLRYKVGAPISSEGAAALSVTWPLRVYEALGLPSEIVAVLWPMTTGAALLTELANTMMANAAPTAALVALAALTRKARALAYR